MPLKSLLFPGRVVLFIVSLAASLLVTSVASAQLRQVYADNVQPENSLKNIDFYSQSSGYVAFRDWIGHTVDTGHTFSRKYITAGNVDVAGYNVNPAFGFGIKGVKAINQNELLIYGHYLLGSTIMRSTDGGSTFRIVFYKTYNTSIPSEGMMNIGFAPGSSTTGYAVDEQFILKTTNGGASWSPVHNQPGDNLNGVQVIDNNTVIAYSGPNTYLKSSSRLYKSTDGGSTWQLVALPGTTLFGAYYLNALTGWVSTSSGLYQTTNGGGTWTRQDSDLTPFSGWALFFANAQTGYALRDYHTVYKSTDGGKYWEPIGSESIVPTTVNFYSLHAYNSDQLWVGGDQGILQLTTNGGGTPGPKAFFSIDTSGYYQSANIKLINHSRTNYTFKWYRNGQLAGTTYNATITGRGFPFTDTLMLVAYQGGYTDTVVKYQHYNEPASISSFSPTTAKSGVTITIEGSYLGNATAVYFGGVPAASFQVINNNTITAVVGTGASGTVSIVTPARGIATKAGFTFLAPPTITSFTPTSSTAGNIVTITGTHFTDVQSVKIGGLGVNFTVVSPTTITALAPSGPSGSIEVTTLGGQSQMIGFVAIPTIKAFSPLMGTNSSILKISGSSLLEVTALSIGGVPVKNFTIHNADSISAVVGEGASGSLVLNSPGGTVSKTGFTYVLPPTITALSPISGTPGTTVTISGSNFNPVAANNLVLFGSLKATVISASASTLTVTVPAGATRNTLSVTNNTLTGYSPLEFQTTFTGGAPITTATFTKMVIPGPQQASRTHVEKAVCDLDGDGKQDLVLMSYIMGMYWTFYRNISTGNQVAFQEVELPLIASSAMSLADVDGDGKPDVIMKGIGGNVVIYRNSSVPGNLKFDDAISFYANLPKEYVNLCVNDLDKDGKPDIAISGIDQIALLRNTGEPGLISFESTVLTHPGDDMLVADVTQDGKPDIVQIDNDGNTIAVHANVSTQGSFGFSSPSIFTAQSPKAIDIADLDHDGKPDIAISSASSNLIQVFRNTGSSGSIGFASPSDITLTSKSQDLTLADLDGDGNLDIAASLTSNHFGTIRNLSTTGTLKFEEVVNHFPADYNNWRQPFTITQGDFNADSKPDLVLIDQTLYKANLYINGSNAKPFIREWTPTMGDKGAVITIKGSLFTGTTAVSFGGVPAASFTVVNDTTLQAIVGTGATGNIAVTNAAGTAEKNGFVFGAIPAITSFSPTSGPVGTRVVVTGKGFDPVPGNNIVYFGGVKVPVQAATGTSLTLLAPAGMSTAGISVTTNNLTATIYRQFFVTYASDTAGFTDASFRLAPQGLPGPFADAADLDRDGKIDFVLAPGSKDALVVRNTSQRGTTSFESPIPLVMPAGVNAAATGDLDGDGYIDIVTVSAESATFLVFRNTTTNGVLSFAPGVPYKLIDHIRPGNSVAIGDLDRDGRPEIITTAPEAYRFTVHKNLSAPGKIAFDTYKEYELTIYSLAQKVVVHDLNNDGSPEVLVITTGPGTSGIGVGVFQNRGQDGVIDLVRARATGNDAAEYFASFSLSDVDGDGRTDFAIGGTRTGSLNLVQNNSQAGSIDFTQGLRLFNYGGVTISGGLGDLDGDGKPELLTYVANEIRGFIHKNVSAPGTISFKTKVSVPPMVTAPNFIDVDGDGAMDIVQGNIYLNSMMTDAIVDICASSDTVLASGFTSNNYQWQEDRGAGFVNVQDNNNIAGSSSQQLKLMAIPDSWHGYKFRCLDESGKPGAAFKLQVRSGQVPASVLIETTKDSICTGQKITFMATAVNGGNSPSFQWLVNGNNVGEGGSTFGTNTLQDGDEIKVVMTSSATCVSNATTESNTIKMGVKNRLTAMVTIKPISTTECSGLPLTFEATPINGGISPTYLWYRNGSWAGDSEGERIQFTDLKNGDQVQATMSVINDGGCYGGNNISSNIITIGGNNPGDPKIPVTPTVSITASSNSVCLGDKVTFTATPVDGGSAPTYQWQVNGINTGNSSATFISDQLKPGDAIKVILTGNAPCTIGTPAISNIITLTGSAPVTPAVSITSTFTSVCEGREVTFTATPVNGGSAPTYDWQVNGVSTGKTSSQFTTTTLKDKDVVTVILTSNAACKTAATAASNAIAMTVNPLVKPQITITASATEICANTKVYFTATIVNGGPAPQILWSDGASGPVNSSSFLNDGDEIYAHLTTSFICIAEQDAGVTSNIIKMKVKPTYTPTVNIATTATDICPGAPATFTATSQYGGAVPQYEWRINDVVVPGNATDKFTTSNLQNGDKVRAFMYSKAECVTQSEAYSNTIAMNVKASLVPTVNITASNTTACAGTNITFTATPTNGGSSPAYQWQVNGINTGQNAPTFSSNTLSNGAQVKVLLTSNATCTSVEPVSSNVLLMTINSLATPSVTISGNTTLDENSASLITANVTNGGNAPTWFWQDSTGTHGWQDIPGIPGASINYKPLETGDKIRVRVISNAGCLLRNTAISTPLTFIVNVPNGGRIAPNPVQNILTIGDLSLNDQWETAEIANAASGSRVEIIRVAGQTSVSVSVAHLTKGVYVVLLRSKTGATKRIKFIKQ